MKNAIKNMNSEMKILSLIMVLSFMLMSILSPSHFLRLETFQEMAFQLPELGLLSLVLMITMLTGGIHLSIIATSNISAIVAALILTSNINPEAAAAGDGWIILLAILSALAVSVVIGLFNGFQI
jgi:ribose/xylose/arabinose/galactoside ABC-type transport system permease subunit